MRSSGLRHDEGDPVKKLYQAARRALRQRNPAALHQTPRNVLDGWKPPLQPALFPSGSGTNMSLAPPRVDCRFRDWEVDVLSFLKNGMEIEAINMSSGED